MRFGNSEFRIAGDGVRNYVIEPREEHLNAIMTIAEHFIKTFNLTSIFDISISDNHPIMPIIDWILIRSFGSAANIIIKCFNRIGSI